MAGQLGQSSPDLRFAFDPHNDELAVLEANKNVTCPVDDGDALDGNQ